MKKLLGKILSYFPFLQPKKEDTVSRCFLYLENEEEGLFFLWSTKLKCPISPGLSQMEFIFWFNSRFPGCNLDSLQDRLELAFYRGTDNQDYANAEELLYGNRAGRDGKCLTKEQLLKVYHYNPPGREARA